MRFSTIVFGITLIAGWIVAFTWAQSLKKNNDNDPPILLGELPDLPPIVLPTVKDTPAASSETSEPSETDEDEGDEEAADADLQQAARDKLHGLKFASAAAPRTDACPALDFNVRDIPMFTPLTALRPRP